jgi:hypothetical protein
MNKKLLIGIIVVIVVMVVFLIAALTRGIIHAVESVIWFWIPLAFWIFLVWIIWKKKIKIFHDQMEPELTERRLKRVKTFLMVSGMSFAMFWLNILLGIAIFGPTEEEGPVAFFIGLFFAVLFVIAAIGGMVTLIKGQRKPP